VNEQKAQYYISRINEQIYAVRVWEEADHLIDELIDLSLEIRDQIGEEGFIEQPIVLIC
jgi:hypothetical protein